MWLMDYECQGPMEFSPAFRRLSHRGGGLTFLQIAPLPPLQMDGYCFCLLTIAQTLLVKASLNT